jgi:hypothetical protein
MKSKFLALVLAVGLANVIAFSPLTSVSANFISSVETLDLERQEELKEHPHELWLIAVNPNVSSSFPSSLSDKILGGHVFIALMKREEDSYEIRQTWGFWGNGGSNGLEIGHERDKEIVSKIINNKIDSNDFGIVISRVGNERADWIEYTAPESAGCDNDKYVAVGGIERECNCMDFATRSFHSFTALQEDFRIGHLVTQGGLLTGYSPEGIIKAIHERNRREGSKYVDFGEIWL